MLIYIMKLNAENNTIVLTLSDIDIKVEIDNVDLTLFNVVNFSVDLTLPGIMTSYHPNNNVETTLKGFLGIDECC